MRLKEHHCINPEAPVPPGGTDDDDLDDGVRNAWFPTVDLFQSGVRPIFTASPDLTQNLLASLGYRNCQLSRWWRGTKERV